MRLRWDLWIRLARGEFKPIYAVVKRNDMIVSDICNAWENMEVITYKQTVKKPLM